MSRCGFLWHGLDLEGILPTGIPDSIVIAELLHCMASELRTVIYSNFLGFPISINSCFLYKLHKASRIIVSRWQLVQLGSLHIGYGNQRQQEHNEVLSLRLVIVRQNKFHNVMWVFPEVLCDPGDQQVLFSVSFGSGRSQRFACIGQLLFVDFPTKRFVESWQRICCNQDDSLLLSHGRYTKFLWSYLLAQQWKGDIYPDDGSGFPRLQKSSCAVLTGCV